MASQSATRCPMCHEEYDDEENSPRVLPCSHTLCTKCIEKLTHKKASICPLCIRNFTVRTSQDVGVNTSLLSLFEVFRECEGSVSLPYVGGVGKHSNLVHYLKRETDDVITKLLESAQEADDEVERNIESTDLLENRLMHSYETICDLQEEYVKWIQYVREHCEWLKSHKVAINEARNALRTIRNKLASAETFIEIAEVADSVESRKTNTEKHLRSFMEHMEDDDRTLLKLQKAAILTRDLIDKLGKIVKSSQMDDELLFTPDLNHMKIRGVIPQVTTIESLRSRSQSAMELMRQGLIFGVQKLKKRKRYAQILLDDRNRICLHYLHEQKVPPKAHVLKHSDILKLMDASSRLVFLELSGKEYLGRLYIRLSPQTKRGDQFALLCSGEKGVSYVQSNLLQIWECGKNVEYVQCGDYENLGGEGGRALVHDSWNEEGGVLESPQRAGLIWGRNPKGGKSEASQFFIFTQDNPGVVHDWCFGIVEEGLNIFQQTVVRYRNDIKQVVISDAGMVLPI